MNAASPIHKGAVQVCHNIWVTQGLLAEICSVLQGIEAILEIAQPLPEAIQQAMLNMPIEGSVSLSAYRIASCNI